MLGLVKRVFGTVNDRVLAGLEKDVVRINGYEKDMEALSDSALQQKTEQFKARLGDGASLDDILHEAFAVVREAGKRVLEMRHFDVQLMGGIVLHRGNIAEMKTGEGKTLAATLPVYLNALTGKGVHVVTVNDYLAQRDAEWMGKLYQFLGLTVGCIVHEVQGSDRKAAYAADITYGTNNEFGFDYLRDNLAVEREMLVQRGFQFAIVDEVDSILVDEARTPLVISGAAEDSSDLYRKVNVVIPKLVEGDFELDEKQRSVTLTEEGTEHIEQLLVEVGLLQEGDSLYNLDSMSVLHHVNQALRAHHLFVSDKDYIVKDKRVVIIDEFTGRMMEGRRYSEGQHQALEAKENVPIQRENQTRASITFQNYFRLYPKLAGMTGTAVTEAEEFHDIYGLDIVMMPPNLPVTRDDIDDAIYRTADEKYAAILETIKACYKKGQPILVGTVTIEKSELLSKMLKKNKIPHQVLNAKFHRKEALIIAQAGRSKAVTIATNMAGRGTDIVLGGNVDMFVAEMLEKKKSADEAVLRPKIEADVKKDHEKVIKAGGLYVLATERHESRRIDNQLRGRAGRQGDPGTTKFFLSLDDDLLRIFGSERISNMLQKFGFDEGESITHPWVNKAIAKAQKKVEQMHYESRKNILKYDDVMSDQRKVIYQQRVELMQVDEVSETIIEMRKDVNQQLVSYFIPPKSYAEQWDIEAFTKEAKRIYGRNIPVDRWAEEEGVADAEILEKLDALTASFHDDRIRQFTPEVMRVVEKGVLLETLDQLWKDHLLSLDHLRQGIGWRAYGQKDPLNEYKREAFMMFQAMLTQLREEVVLKLAHVMVSVDGNQMKKRELGTLHETREDPALDAYKPSEMIERTARTRVKAEDRNPNDPETWGRVGRNEPCVCGSGKKYKHCHGQL